MGSSVEKFVKDPERAAKAVFTGGASETNRTVKNQGDQFMERVSGAEATKDQAAAEQARLKQEEQSRSQEESRLKEEALNKENRQREQARMQGPGSRASTLLTSGQGVEEEDLNVARRTLLGK